MLTLLLTLGELWNMGKHIAVYVRVSTGKQDTASQEPDLKRWLATNAPSAEMKWYRDVFTGKTMDRPGMQRLLNAVAAGDVSTVLVWKVDRLGRTARGLTALFDGLQCAGVNLVSMQDSLDLSTSSGRLLANILASVANWETEVRADRIRAGIAAKRERGETWGNGRPKGSKTACTPEKAKLAHQLKAEGYSISKIAKTLGISRGSVYNALK